jgi:2-amino-4-hydroxy-6-hydroxymethyldihydropteridine diphosphokinase
LTRAYVGLGANLGDREGTIGRALQLLASDPSIDLVAVSTLRETEPVGDTDQPFFMNGAAMVETELSPRALLARLLAIERELGRVRNEERRFGPRTIDLDLLVYGDRVVDEPGLTVPHPRLAERRFALEPLHELDPGLTLPDGRAVRDLLGSQLQ